MSKFKNKAMMFAVIVSAGAGQVFAAEKDVLDHGEKRNWSLNCFRSCMRDAVADVKEAAPVIHELGTTAIEIGKVVATIDGNKKVVRNLDKAQDVLDETLELTQADDIQAALEAGKDIVHIVDPRDGRKIIDRIEKAEENIAVLKPKLELVAGIIEAAAVNVEAKHS